MILPAYAAYANGLDLSGSLIGLSWEHMPDELAARAIATVGLHPTRDTTVLQHAAEGASLVVLADGAVVFDGTVFDWHFSEMGAVTLQLTAYDRTRYLVQSEDDVKFSARESAHARLEKLGTLHGFAWARLDLPDLAFDAPTDVYRGKTLGQMVIDTVRKVEKLTGRQFVVRSATGDALEVVEVGANATTYTFDASNSELMEDERSIARLVTQVKIVGTMTPEITTDPKDNPQPTRPNVLRGYTQFGTLQKLVYSNLSTDSGVAAQEAQAILEERGAPTRVQKVRAPDRPDVRKGDRHVFRVGTLGGIQPIVGVQHDAARATVLMYVSTSGQAARRERTGATPFPDLPEGGSAAPARVPGVE